MTAHTSHLPHHHIVAGSVLMGEPVEPSDMDAAFREVCQDIQAASTSDSGDTILQYRDGHVEIFLTAVAGSNDDPAVVEYIHPILTKDEEVPHIINHRGQVLVVAASFNDAPVADVAQESLAVHQAHARALQQVLGLPGAAGYHREGTTMGVSILKNQLESDVPAPTFAWAPVWLWAGDDGMTAYTFGLSTFGHPELQIVDSQREAREVFALLNDLVVSITLGAIKLDDGDKLAREDTVITAHAAPWLVDTSQPAMRLEF